MSIGRTRSKLSTLGRYSTGLDWTIEFIRKRKRGRRGRNLRDIGWCVSFGGIFCVILVLFLLFEKENFGR
jgi:hypothetical protein